MRLTRDIGQRPPRRALRIGPKIGLPEASQGPRAPGPGLGPLGEGPGRALRPLFGAYFRPQNRPYFEAKSPVTQEEPGPRTGPILRPK